MNRKLYKVALITSPIIAIYGVCPFYIFKIIGLVDVLMLSFVLMTVTFIAWALLIQLKNRYPSLNNISLFIISYGINLGIRLLLLIITYPFGITIPAINDIYFVYLVATSFVVNAIIVVILNSIINAYKYVQSERELQDIKLQHSEAQKAALVQQMQPHFLFNALSNLKSLIKENADDAENYTIKLSEFLRYSVESHQSQLVTLAKELDFTIDYIELQKVRFGNAFSYQIHIPPDVKSYKIPVLALQTIVENIFKHNTFTIKKPLNFDINYHDETLIICNQKSVLNITLKTSTGLTNLQQRYQLVLQKSIIVENSDNYFSVTIPIVAP